jgi:hypothetical protein
VDTQTIIVFATNPVVLLVGLAAAFVGLKVFVKNIRSLGGDKFEVDVDIEK